MLVLTKFSFWKEDHSVHQILTQPSFVEEVGGKEKMNFLREGDCNFYIKNNVKPEIFNDKSLKKKCFSVITKNSNCEILIKNFVTFKR